MHIYISYLLIFRYKTNVSVVVFVETGALLVALRKVQEEKECARLCALG